MRESKTGQFNKKILIGFIILLIGTNLINYFMFGHKPEATPAEIDPGEESNPAEAAALEELGLLGEVLRKVTDNYFEPVDEAELIRGAIRGRWVLDDPQTNFLDSSDVENYLVNTTGTLAGLVLRS